MYWNDYRRMMEKRAASVMTPEAMQAAQQPPMDPAMQQQGGMPPQGDPSMQDGAPMDPSMQGGMPPQGMDPSMMGGDPSMQGGGQLPPEIMQDQMFLQFLAEAMGIMLDPNSGQFMDQQGQPVPPDAIMQLYQQFQQQMAMMQQQGGMPPQGMDPSMMGGDPSMQSGMPPQGDPSMQGGAPTDNSMQGGMSPQAGAPMDMGQGMQEEAQGAGAPPVPDEIMNQISSAVMSGVEAVLQDFASNMEQKFAELNSKIDALGGGMAQAQETDDGRTEDELEGVRQLRDELANELQPVKQASVVVREIRPDMIPINIFDLIRGL